MVSKTAIMRQLSKRHYLSLAGALALFLCLLSIIPFLLQLPSNIPGKADAIIVLGGGTGDRVSKSLALFKAEFAGRLVLTGNEQAPSHRNAVIDDARADFLVSREVPRKKILYVFPSSNSWLEAKSTLALMQHHNWDNVIVVSDPPHMLRLSYTWKKAFDGHPKNYVLVATDPAWWRPLTWWGNRTSSVFVLSELMKLMYYVIAY